MIYNFVGDKLIGRKVHSFSVSRRKANARRAVCEVLNSGTQISGKGGHHMTKLEIIDEMPPAFLDVEDIMKKKRSKRSMEENEFSKNLSNL